jgi:hypothetical protein
MLDLVLSNKQKATKMFNNTMLEPWAQPSEPQSITLNPLSRLQNAVNNEIKQNEQPVKKRPSQHQMPL